MINRLNLTPVKRPDRMLSYWKKAWPSILIVTVTGLLFNGSMSLIPALQGKLLDAVIYHAGISAVIRQMILFIVAVLAIQGMRIIKRYYVRVFANQTGAVMRRIIYNNILYRNFAELLNEKTGDLMNKAVNDVDLCVEGMRKVTTEFFDTGVLMVGYVVSMLLYDWKITLISCVFIPAAMLLAQNLKRKIELFNREARAQSSAVAQLTYSDITLARLYRINSVMPIKRIEYDAELADLERKSIKAGILENSMQPIYNAIAMLGIGAILYLGGLKVIDNIWTVGTFTAYIAIFTALATKASKGAKLFNAFQKSTVSWKRLKPYYSGYQEVDNANRPDKNQSGLDCRNLTFRFPESTRNILENISFSVEKGEFIGVTGPVACGKTALGLALTGAYPCQSGAVLINGNEMSALSPAERSQRFSYLGHEALLFSDTIYNNITLGQDGDIRGVLRDVCFDEDLASMPEGEQTVVGNNGVRLSGGQQARIGLARALWHQAPVMILDDPFSAVDMRTEEAIMGNLRAHYPDRCFVVISHRLKNFPRMDRVLYIENGQGICDSHEQLLETSTGYRELYALQAEDTGK